MARGLCARCAARSRSPEPHSSGSSHSSGQRDEGRGDELARAGIAPEQPQSVEADQGPGLGAQQRGADRRTGRRGGCARRGGGRPRPARAPRAGPRSCRAPSCAASTERPRRRPRRRRRPATPPSRRATRKAMTTPAMRAGARDEQPQVRGEAAEERERRGQQDRQRLPRRARRRSKVEVQDLPAPDDPGPRVVRRRRRDEEGQRGEREDREHDPMAHGDARHGERRHAGTGCGELVRGVAWSGDRRLWRTRCCPPFARRCKRPRSQLRARDIRCRAMIRRVVALAWLVALDRSPPPPRGPTVVRPAERLDAACSSIRSM